MSTHKVVYPRFLDDVALSSDTLKPIAHIGLDSKMREFVKSQVVSAFQSYSFSLSIRKSFDKFIEDGIIKSCKVVKISADSVNIQVVVDQASWSDSNRSTIIDHALDMEDQYDITVLISTTVI